MPLGAHKLTEQNQPQNAQGSRPTASAMAMIGGQLGDHDRQNINGDVSHFTADAIRNNYQHDSRSSSDQHTSRDNSKHLQNILDVMPAGVVILDECGCVRQANAAAIDMLGEPLEGETWRTIISRSFRPRVDDGHEISLHDGRRVKLSMSPLAEEAGQLILLTDLTETRLLQQRMSHMQRLSSLGKMVASLAHQLRTPLSAATLYAANLLNPTLSHDSREQFCGKLQSRLKDLENQINDMLIFAKSGSEQVVTEVPMQSLLEEVEVGSETMLENKQCDLTIYLAEPDLCVLGNKTALASALQNVIHNSLQFAPTGSTIQLNVCRSAVDRQILDISVSDEGSGIPDDKLTHIFEPFFTTRSQGTGLGLAVVKSVAQAHKGSVSAKNNQDGGAKIVMHLPILYGSGNCKSEQSHIRQQAQNSGGHIQ